MERAAELLPPAIAELEKVPFPADAARLRRQYAAVLRDNGRPDEAIREMRRAHEVFSRLGAEPELDAVRNNLREMGARPPVRSSPGEGVLTGRETEIARLVAERRSNKAIGVALRLSSRTVSTHLSNIFRKLGISTRAELTDRMRQGELSKRPDLD
jgi:DNA-binding NarL/FixJ family response regulator